MSQSKTQDQLLKKTQTKSPSQPTSQESLTEDESPVEETPPQIELLIKQEGPDSERIFQALTTLAELLTSAPDIDVETLGSEDLALSYHVIVTTKGEKVEYRNSVKLPMALSLENEVDALDMIEAQLDLTTRPAKNFCMRLLREMKEGGPLRIVSRD